MLVLGRRQKDASGWGPAEVLGAQRRWLAPLSGLLMFLKPERPPGPEALGLVRAGAKDTGAVTRAQRGCSSRLRKMQRLHLDTLTLTLPGACITEHNREGRMRPAWHPYAQALGTPGQGKCPQGVGEEAPGLSRASQEPWPWPYLLQASSPPIWAWRELLVRGKASHPVGRKSLGSKAASYHRDRVTNHKHELSQGL